MNQYYTNVEETQKVVNISFTNWNESIVNVYIKVNSKPSLTEYDYLLTESDSILSISNTLNQTYYIGVYGKGGGQKGDFIELYSLTVAKSENPNPDTPFWDLLTIFMVLFFGGGGLVVSVVVILIVILVCCGIISCAICNNRKKELSNSINYGNNQHHFQIEYYQHI
ncbi:predicted protein [Naegleria gruberi]|uniref:Predicted protein n=1 Tax=Naegleria gruberi TaxID=5762 RepID=D2V3N1_NAEGR|nr:uncharacterized protein NAEGRDRAFT_63426 [Naegleria gruberi]EFC48801.1 predicted protein [Naegleria gruberi]|eukprot:XP_002681545.1 predicted protein [Naegleria gruberi strain NEG-M]